MHLYFNYGFVTLLSSWIGVEVGYVHSAFDNAMCKAQCSNSSNSYVPDAFILVVETIRKLAALITCIMC